MTDARAVLLGAMTEAQLQAHVIRDAQVFGWHPWHDAATNHARQCPHCSSVLKGPRNKAGWPDLWLVRERLVVAEVKTETGVLSAAQRAWLDRLAAAGVETHVWRPSDLADGTIARVLRGEQEG